MKLVDAEEGSALIEFAVFLSVMILLLLASVDYAVLIVYKMELQEAATGAAEYGAIPGNESNLTTIQSYARNLAPYVRGVSATATNVWMCTPGGASVAGTASCNGTTPYKYVTVTTSASLPRVVVYSGLAASTTLQGFAQIRVPWTP